MSEPLVTGNRVYLRVMEPEDARALALSETGETETWHSEHGRMPTSALAFEHMLHERDKAELSRAVILAICLRESDECIGMTSIRDIDWINRSAETGIRIYAQEYRNRGYGPEAKHLALKYAFETLGLHSIRADIFAPNVRSAAALRKQGYRPAGRLEAEVCIKGVYYDILLFDLLRPDWEAAYAEWIARHGSS